MGDKTGIEWTDATWNPVNLELLEEIRHGAPKLDWIIAGGESGPNARPAHPDWFRWVRDQCQEADVPFFFKQWGEWGDSPIMERVGKKFAGSLLDGREWKEFPTIGGQDGGHAKGV